MDWNSLSPLLLVGLFAILAVLESVPALARGRDSASSDARLLTNFTLTAVLIVVSALLPLARIGSSVVGDRLGIGIASFVPLSAVAAFAMLLVLDSLAAYWVHRWMHVTPLLWRVHRVHHADSALDVSTSFRSHPLELMLTIPVTALVVLLVGAPVSVVIAAQTVFVAVRMWQHADITLPPRIDAALARLIVTPRLHRLHHNPERVVHDSNFGESIVFWDWVFGTLNRDMRRLPVGLRGQAARADHLLDQLRSPFQSTRRARVDDLHIDSA